MVQLARNSVASRVVEGVFRVFVDLEKADKKVNKEAL